MSLTQVRTLIAKSIPELNTNVQFEGKPIADKVEAVLTTYREAKKYDLAEDDKRRLRNHLLWAGQQVCLLVEHDDSNGRHGPANKRGQRNMQLLMAVANELGMTPQQLQAAMV